MDKRERPAIPAELYDTLIAQDDDAANTDEAPACVCLSPVVQCRRKYLFYGEQEDMTHHVGGRGAWG